MKTIKSSEPVDLELPAGNAVFEAEPHAQEPEEESPPDESGERPGTFYYWVLSRL